MEQIPKGKWTPEFRAEAVKRVEMTCLSVVRAAQRRSTSIVIVAREASDGDTGTHRFD